MSSPRVLRRPLFKLFSREPIHDPLAAPDRRRGERDQDDDVLHVRLPLRHPRAPARRRAALHRRQSRAPDQPRRDLRQGRRGDHEAGVAGAADAAAAAEARQRARRRRVRADLVGARRSRSSSERLATIRATDPKKFALFTGRDQMQALTGLFARQFGTPNYAAHGGFCSVNMAAGMIYTIGGSFWEFGGPDLDRARLFVMIGTAEDHHSNPLKIAISQVQARGRALHLDQPGAHRLLGHRRRVDPDQARHRRRALHGAAARADRAATASTTPSSSASPTRRSSCCWTTGCDREGMFAHDPDPAKGPPGDGRASAQQAGVRQESTAGSRRPIPKASPTAATRRSTATTRWPTARRVAPSFQLLRERVAPCTPEWAAAITGIPAARIVKLAAGARLGRASSRRSSCRSPGPTPGARRTRRPRPVRSPSTPCAAWRRTRTASRRCARWRC